MVTTQTGSGRRNQSCSPNAWFSNKFARLGKCFNRSKILMKISVINVDKISVIIVNKRVVC